MFGVMDFVECDENILDKRTDDVSKLLSKLRSVSMTDHQVSKLTNDGDWKVWFFLFWTSDTFPFLSTSDLGL